MYFHIGYNKVVNTGEMVGIFGLKSLSLSKEKSFLNKLEKNDIKKFKSVILFKDGSVEFSKFETANLLRRYRKEMDK